MPGSATPSSSRNKVDSVSVLILAGGASRRMGANKALLTLEGTPLIERVLRVARSITDEVLLIANDPEPYRYLSLPTVPDLESGQGPLMGLYSGLQAARGELALLVACDMPFLRVEVLQLLLDSAPGYDVVMPKTGDGLHPLCAVYRRQTCAPAIARALHAHKRKMIAFLDEVRVRYITADQLQHLDPKGLSLMNINTPEELARARAILQTQ